MDGKAIAYLPVKLYSYPFYKRLFLTHGNYRQMRRLGASRKLSIVSAVKEAIDGCIIYSPKPRPSHVLDNLGLVIKLDD